MSKQILDAALTYADLGYPVFPCQPGGKVPLTEHGFKDATTDPEQIEAWWRKTPWANIGLPTTGLLVVDIDGPDNPWPEGPGIDLAPGAVSLTPGGGRHLVYRRPKGKPWRNRAGKLAPRVDTRTDGGYIVVPPSHAPGRHQYAWAQGCALDIGPGELPTPPGWLAARLSLLEMGPSAPATAPSGPQVQDGNPIPPGQRNDTLTRLAGVMRHAGMAADAIRAALLATNAARCSPPLLDAEVEKVARSVARYTPDQIMVGVIENHWGQLQDADDEECEPAGPPDPGPFPEELLTVPGFVGQVMEYCLKTAHKPQPILALGSAICLQAVLAARKVRDPRGNQTNLYVVGVAPSGRGKERPRAVNGDILFRAGLGHLNTNDDFASDSGLLKAVELQPAILFQVDEIGRTLETCAEVRQSHLYHITTALLRLYSSAGKVFKGKAYADEKRNVQIHQPCVSLLGMTTPDHLYKALQGESVGDGFMARLIILQTDANPPRQRVPLEPVPPEILDVARWWGQQHGNGNLDGENPEPRLVDYTEEAGLRFDRLAATADAENAGGYAALWARAEEKACRLALIYACSAQKESPIIDGQAVEWACRLSEYLTRRMVFMANQWIAEGAFDAKQKKILRILQEHDGEAAQSLVTRATRPWPIKERNAVLQNMLATGQLISHVVPPGPQGGPPKTIFTVP